MVIEKKMRRILDFALVIKCSKLRVLSTLNYKINK